MSRTPAQLQRLSEPVWISGCRALWGQPLQAPTEAMLERWPEAHHYRAVSRPAGGRLRRRLGWLETVTAIALEDDGHAVVVEGHFPWWPYWPLAHSDCLTLASVPS